MKHPTDGEIRLGQGMERSRQFLIDNPDLGLVIEEAIFKKLSPLEAASPEEEAAIAAEAPKILEADVAAAEAAVTGKPAAKKPAAKKAKASAK